jgi:hypothetical protein
MSRSHATRKTGSVPAHHWLDPHIVLYFPANEDFSLRAAAMMQRSGRSHCIQSGAMVSRTKATDDEVITLTESR